MALILAIPILIVALVPVAQAAPTRTLAITSGSADPSVAFRGFDGNPPLAFDFNRDGRKEIVAQNDNQYAYVFDSKSGELLAQKKTTFPSGWGARTFNGPEAYHEDGVSHLVLVNSAAYVTSYRYDPTYHTASATHFPFVKEWEKRMTGCNSNPGSDSKPTLGDLDGDGKLEIVVTTEEQGIYALRSNGALMWQRCINGGNAEAVIRHLDGGNPEVIFGSDTGEVWALRGKTGSTFWYFNVHWKFNLGSGSIPVAVAVGQLDGVGGPDVVFGARDSHDANDWTKDHAVLVALDSNGKFLWGKQDPKGNPLTYTRPVITDAAGDGNPEVYWADWNTVGHKPPFDSTAWQQTGPANFYKYDRFGNMVWKQSLPTFWSNKDIPIADVDGDGVQEMLANGPNANGGDGIWFLNTATGAKESHLALSPWKVQRNAIVTDLQGDGRMDLVIEAAQQYSGAGGAAVLVYDAGVAMSVKWGHPPGPYKGSSPAAASGTFAATFTITSPGTWWQQVTVKPDTARTITRVEVQVNDGVWNAMKKTDYGAWTSSVNAPSGSKVEFRAWDSNNKASTSQPFTWMDGTTSKRSVSDTFTATFTPKSITNNWWIEVAVSGSQTVSKVDARINGGTWTNLPKTDWGTYAKSINAPDGSKVEFRATSTTGSVVTSQAYTWG